MRLLLLLLCLSLTWPIASEASDTPTTVAVMPFAKLKGDKTVWLDKAIADLVAQKLGESSHYTVLDRDALQVFLKEMQLADNGFTIPAPGEVQRLGKVASVAQMVYGNYELSGSHIVIHAMVMDVASQSVRMQKDIDGEIKSLIPLSGQLVERLLADDHVAVSSQEKTSIAFAPTDSLPAMEHFYNGIYAYDKGDYETAMGEFFAAQKQDTDYLDARLWFARMLEQLGKDDEAIRTYLALYTKAPQSIEGIDACYFAARLQARTSPEDAIASYRKLSVIHPEIPETLEAAYQVGLLYRAKNDVPKSYAAFKQLDDFSDYVRKHTEAYAQKWASEENVAYADKRQSFTKLMNTKRSGAGKNPGSGGCTLRRFHDAPFHVSSTGATHWGFIVRQ